MLRPENSEAPTTCDSQGLLSNISSEGNIDMNIVAKSDLNFHGVMLNPVENVTGVWLTSADVAKALGYKSTKSISNLFTQYEDEFSQGMTMVIESMTNGINGSCRRLKVRVFSLRGAHLIAMFARTPVAKEFRRWVLDILDREVQHSPIAKQFTDQELCDLAWLWRAGAVMITACRDIYPLLKVAEHRQAGHFYSIGHEFTRTLNKGREVLKRETAHIEFQPWKDDNWSRVLPHLRQEILQ
ncbi:Bro-N domain-containing protein [Enterobacter cloacae]|uniref:P22AR C-terminal domain-containing protein n=1 Tax=Enterobacter cloacae TaxID=550 RepID=UPI001BDF67B1|nr:P22AR C-terminal domain-containing protein [Enterobacter cloacae]MBT1833540.1 Bro-N domain-containing protein [Enterobacter cloacae]